MSWFSTSWKQRAPISLDRTGGTGSADATVSLPATWDRFWSGVSSNSGDDIRITDSDGLTLVTFDLDSFSKSGRTGTLEIDNYSVSTVGMYQLWLYWNSSGASTAVTPFVPATPKTGYIDPGLPTRLFRYRPERYGATVPRDTFVKASAEQVKIAVDFGAALQKARAPVNGHFDLEEIQYATVDVQTGGVSTGTAFDVTKTRILLGGRVSCLIKGGSSGTDYTVIVTVTTTLGNVFEKRVRMSVRNVVE